MATPMLADRKYARFISTNGFSIAASTRRAMRSISARSDSPVSSRMNSSPPMRPATSCGRIDSRRRVATSISTWSPTEWPRVSLMIL